MYKIIEFLFAIYGNFMVAYFLNNVLIPINDKNKQLKISCLFVLVLTMSVRLINNNEMLKISPLVVFFSMTSIYSIYMFKNKLFEKLFYSLIPHCILVLSDKIMMLMLPYIYYVDILTRLTEIENMILFFALICARTIQSLITILLINIFKRNRIELSEGKWLGFSIICILSILCSRFIFEMKDSSEPIIISEMYTLSVICLVFINIFVFTFYVSFTKKSTENLRYKLNETKIQEQIKATEEIEKAFSDLRELRHDIVNQYSVVQSLISEKNYDQAYEYLTKLTGYAEQEIKQTYIINTKYQTINAVINRYISKCKELNISLECAIFDIDVGEIDILEISSIISNILNNAIEASENIESATITISIYNKLNYLIISSSNMITTSVLQSNPEFNSTKQDLLNHGFGVKSIKKIVSKYDGMLNFNEQGDIISIDIWLNKTLS